ncbi:hypothetical protein Tco_0261651 [Tanacetum coccineum]
MYWFSTDSVSSSEVSRYDLVLDATTKLLKHSTISSPSVIIFSGFNPSRGWKALDDGDDVNDKLSLELRYIAKKVVKVYANGSNGVFVLGRYRVLEVMFGVKKGFSAYVSAGSGSGGSIRRIQLMDMAY